MLLLYLAAHQQAENKKTNIQVHFDPVIKYME